MRVLHLPQNIASLPSHSVRYLRQIGVDASGLIFANTAVQSTAGIKVFATAGRSSQGKYLDQFAWFLQMARLAARVDVIHWYYGRPILPHGFDLAWIKLLNKPALVEWMGSDIRQPEIEFTDNPYYTQAYHNGYEYAATETQAGSRQYQRQFSRLGFACGTDRGLIQYIDREAYPDSYYIPRRLILDDYPAAYPEPQVASPVVLHSPTAPVAKGTPAVLKAVGQVQAKHPFEFHLVEGLPRPQAMQLMQTADILLDQFVLGDYGMAALEAMAFGKPVICYIKKSLADLYGPELPIVNATQETLAETLLALLQNPERRRELGEAGRAYVQKNADMQVIAPRLLETYQAVIAARRGNHGG